MQESIEGLECAPAGWQRSCIERASFDGRRSTPDVEEDRIVSLRSKSRLEIWLNGSHKIWRSDWICPRFEGLLAHGKGGQNVMSRHEGQHHQGVQSGSLIHASLGIPRTLAVLLIVQLLLSFAGIGTADAATNFPTISTSHISPNDATLASSIDLSGPGELTLASFNVRNLGARERSLKDFEAIVDLVDEADIVVFQEAGLGLFRNSTSVAPIVIEKRWQVILSAFRIYFGPGWKIITAERPTGQGKGSESTIVAYREVAGRARLSVKWQEYVDLGSRRDMAVFKVRLSSERGTRTLQLGSVHLKPTDPDRGAEMTKAVDWLVSQHAVPTIVAGDFNWGYPRKGKGAAYKGENHVTSLNAQGMVFQPFADISYLDKGDADKFRTNLGFRRVGKMYDQFLLSASLANQLADGGRFLEDIGIVAFDIRNCRMRRLVKRDEGVMQKALEIFLKESNLDLTMYESSLDEAKKEFHRRSQDRATYRISDHRPIWIQLKMF